MAKHRRIDHFEEREDEETRAAVALTEAKTRVVLRLATRSALWVAVLVLVSYYLFEAVRWVFDALTGVLLVAQLWFHIPFAGSYLTLYFGLAVFVCEISSIRSARASPAQRPQRQLRPLAFRVAGKKMASF